MDDRRTPLARARGLGSAKDGVHHWWVQRLTAVALIPLVVWFAISLVMLSGADYAVVRAWIGSPLVMVLLILTSASACTMASSACRSCGRITPTARCAS
jgi:succinate dehydrogenase / fumarate reductase membrane anchor subunit